MSDDPFASQPVQLEQIDYEGDRAALSHEPHGLGGWLILVGIGLVVTAIRLPVSLATTFFPLFTQGQWAALTTPGSKVYHPLWAPLLICETLGTLLFAVLAAALLFLFFSKSRWFPRIFIVYVISILLFDIADFFLVNRIPAAAAQHDFDPVMEIVRAILASAIWVPYMLVSKRVKNTFGKPGARPKVEHECVPRT